MDREVVVREVRVAAKEPLVSLLVVMAMQMVEASTASALQAVEATERVVAEWAVAATVAEVMGWAAEAWAEAWAEAGWAVEATAVVEWVVVDWKAVALALVAVLAMVEMA